MNGCHIRISEILFGFQNVRLIFSPENHLYGVQFYRFNQLVLSNLAL
jgi:hypothetical protein